VFNPLKSLFTNLDEIHHFFNFFFNFNKVVFKLNLSHKLVIQYLNFHCVQVAISKIFSSKFIFSKEKTSIIFIVHHKFDAFLKITSFSIQEIIK